MSDAMGTITASQAIKAYKYAITRTLDEFLPEPVTYVDGIYRTLDEAKGRLGLLALSSLSGTFAIARIVHDGEVADGE